MGESATEPTDEDRTRWHRIFATSAFNHTWELLDLESLDSQQEEEMLAATFAQRHHWYTVGEPRNWAIADWQVARVATVLGYFDLARRFAKSSLELGKHHDLGPFVIGFGHEAMARAAAQVDDIQTFSEHIDLARSQLALITDEDERVALESDLAQMSET